MKLFNNNIDFKFIQKIFKLIIILLLVFYCIYILYFSSNIIEGFTTNLDCSNCQMKPNSGDCIPIYDFSYNIVNGSYSDLSLIDTSYIFCPWEANCTTNNYLSNMDNHDVRLGISNEDFEYNKGVNNITCCSESDFYNTNTTSYFQVTQIANARSQCTPINNYVYNILNNNPENTSESNFINQTYLNYKNFCNQTDFSGMLFKKNVIDHSNILLNPDLTIQEIFDYQNVLEMSLNTILDGIVQTQLSNNTINGLTIDQINNQLKQLNTNPNQTRSNQGYTKFQLQTMLSKFFANDISYQDISYIPVNSSLIPIINPINNNQYILNEDQFFNCFGDVSNTQIMKLNQLSIQNSLSIDNIDNNYFGVSDETIKTASELTPYNYGPSMDLAMELANLENIQPGGTAPVSVINQYLTAINGFYENQIQNLIGPRTHAINDQIVFDNNTLETKTNTFLTYENDANNTYECTNSVTQDSKFEYCGPTPYYSNFNL